MKPEPPVTSTLLIVRLVRPLAFRCAILRCRLKPGGGLLWHTSRGVESAGRHGLEPSVARFHPALHSAFQDLAARIAVGQRHAHSHQRTFTSSTNVVST